MRAKRYKIIQTRAVEIDLYDSETYASDWDNEMAAEDLASEKAEDHNYDWETLSWSVKYVGQYDM